MMKAQRLMCAESAMIAYIYLLIDPRDGEIRYVGKTERDLLIRLRDHIKEARSGKRHSYRNYWIAKLLRLGYRPRIQLIQIVPQATWRSAESYWIQYYRSIGCPLTNGTTGGDGQDHFTDETRSKMSEAAILKFQNPEIKAKYMGNQNSRGRDLTPELRANLTAGQFRRYGYPWEQLQDDYARLGTCKAVAELYGCHEEVVRRALKREGIQAHGFNLAKGEHTEEWTLRWASLAQDYERLGTQQAVADEYGVTQRQVQKAMKKLGIKALPVAGRKKQIKI